MPDIKTHWTDIKTGTWFDRHCPDVIKPYARLMRLDRPIGTWLLLLPCWWGVALASPHFPDLWLMLLFALGAVVMRGAGCVINDIYDRELDKKVERTRTRPLASGEIQLWQAILLLMVLLLIGLGVLLAFNTFTIITGMVSLILVAIYPLMKRITWWPQLFLGFTFNWGALMGYSAVMDTLDMRAIILYMAGIFWTLGYDTIYAHQDVKDDERVGIKSTARLFGTHSKYWITFFYALSLVAFVVVGCITELGKGFYICILLASGFAAIQIALWKPEDPQDCSWRFGSNRNFGLLILLGIILGHYI
ncbi:MAG: 4-hydroxybenzoate octaprenyltransferase [Alphaproteobacteria bacterium]